MEFVTQYTKKLENPLESSNQILQHGVTEIPERGSRQDFNEILKYYKDKLNSLGSMKKLINEVFPQLYDGISCTLLHALIQLGYGIKIDNERVTLEGLSYLHYSYYSPFAYCKTDRQHFNKFGRGSKNFLDVLKIIRQDDELVNNIDAGMQSDALRQTGIGCDEMKVVAALRSSSDKIFDYVDQIKFPDWFNSNSLDSSVIDKLSIWVFDVACTIFDQSTVQNEFRFLHFVTSSWSLRQILILLEDHEISLRTIRIYFWSLFVIFALGKGNLLTNASSVKGTLVHDKEWTDLKQQAREKTCQ